LGDLAGVRRRSGKRERESRKVVFIKAVRFEVDSPANGLIIW